MKIIVCVLFALLLALPVAAQEPLPVGTPQVVQVNAVDGLVLFGDYYAVPTTFIPPGGAPAVLLLHMLGSNRNAWSPLVPALTAEGYHVLAVDLRGYGQTGGDPNWELAVGDIQTWLLWLRQQTGVKTSAIYLVGASIGGNLALIGCASDPQCVTAVALSPGLDYHNVLPESAIVNGLRGRSALLVVAQGDTYSADSVRQLVVNAVGEIGAQFYNGQAHGTNLLVIPEDPAGLILHWLEAHRPPAQ